jgi:TolB-like protein/DNA-binding winged helix-turn-helix (wHTH) protein
MRSLSETHRFLRFGDFELDLESAELRQGGNVVKLHGQPLTVLALLASRPGRVVSREELGKEVWGSETFVDFDQGLNFCIKQIRSALGDDARHPRYIETLPRRGYRFIAGVDTGSVLRPEPVPAAAMEPPEPAGRRFGIGSIIGLVAVLAVTVAAAVMVWKRTPQPQASSTRIMLAVLPFANLSGSREQDYVSDGMTEEMITQLGRIDPAQLGVIARTSAMKYRADDKDIEDIGRELNVQYIVEGSVRLAQSRVRIAAQLIQTRDQAQVWSGSYDRDLRDILALQSEVARTIAQEIRIRLPRQTVPPPAARTVDFEVYQLYLRGRYFWNRRSSTQSDVGGGGQAEQVRERGQLRLGDDRQDQRREHEADGVVHEQGGQTARHQDQRPEERPRRLRPGQDEPGGPPEELGLHQVGGDHHHPEQEEEGVEVDRRVGLLHGQDPEGDHRHRPAQRRGRPVHQDPGEPLPGHRHVGDHEDDEGGRDAGILYFSMP